ncbi:MAG: amidohydrolase family protein [Vicingaceae bacterium]|nr:amidohydrolase family protein [Vicingaceae bacterium]
MKLISADYIYPITSSPIKNGVVGIDDSGKILALLNPEKDDIDWEKVEQYEGIICPGFINTHCHLELSYLKGVINEKTLLTGFIKDIVAVRENFSETERIKAIEEADKEMFTNGIVAVGDISNGNSTFKLKEKSNIHYHTFIEVFGTNTDIAQQAIDNALQLRDEHPNNSVSIVPHAPYSMSPTLVKKLAKLKEETICIHNQETESENEMFEKGEGDLLKIMQNFAPEMHNYQAFNKSSLQSYLPNYFDSKKILLVHNTFTKQYDITFANKSPNDIFWCFCPNANLYIENKLPNYNLFLNEKCTIGTDSLASNWSLSVLDELKVIHKNNSTIGLEKLLKWATLNGAEFLGFDDELGSLEIGKSPGLNLISNVEKNQLTNKSTVKRIDL